MFVPNELPMFIADVAAPPKFIVVAVVLNKLTDDAAYIIEDAVTAVAETFSDVRMLFAELNVRVEDAPGDPPLLYCI